MPTFTIRVELYDIGTQQKSLYDELHKKMEAAGFSRVVTLGRDVYHLPDAEYSYGDASSAAVLELAKRTALGVWSKARILVTQTNEQRLFWDLIPFKGNTKG